MRAVALITVVLIAVLLVGCGGSSNSTSTGATEASSAKFSPTKPSSTHLTRPVQRQEEQASETRAEEEAGEQSSSVSDAGSYNGINLCDLDQIEGEVRTLYEVDPKTEVICKPAKSQEGVVAAWNWWVVQPPNHFRTPETPAEVEQQEQLEELVGEKAPGYRIEVGIGENQVNGENVWATEKKHAANPVNELELIEVAGRDAIWGAHYLLLTPMSEDQNLVIATLSGYTENGPADGEPAAISIAELVENEAF